MDRAGVVGDIAAASGPGGLFSPDAQMSKVSACTSVHALGRLLFPLSLRTLRCFLVATIVVPSVAQIVATGATLFTAGS